MGIGSSEVANYANTSTGVAERTVADVSDVTAPGRGVGGVDVYVAYGTVIPVGALYDRADSPLLDRSGNYIQVRA